MDTDIRGFADMLAGYKSTISVALADANLRSSTVTRKVLDEYKQMIRATTEDLEDHLREIGARLEALAPLGARSPALTSDDVQWFERERQSTEQCLEICAQGLARIDEMRVQAATNGGPDAGTGAQITLKDLTLAEITTTFALRKCQDELALGLHAREEQVGRYAGVVRPAEPGGPASPDELRTLAGESDSTRQCLAVLRDASERAASDNVHVLEDVSVDPDGEQTLITSRDQLFEVKRVKLGSRAKQVVMSSSPEAVRDFLKSHVS